MELKVIWFSGSGNGMLLSQDFFFYSSCSFYVQASIVHVHFESGCPMDDQKKTVKDSSIFPERRHPLRIQHLLPRFML